MKISHFSRDFVLCLKTFTYIINNSTAVCRAEKACNFAVLRGLCYQPHEPFVIVTTVCTVDFETEKALAAARTVALFLTMYSPNSTARISTASRKKSPPEYL